MSKTLKTSSISICWNSFSSSSHSSFMELGLTMMKSCNKAKVICRNSPDRFSGDDGLIKVSETGGTDVIIVGAGVAGSALAYALAKDGRRVHILERDLTEPNRMVGEVLHPGGYLKLIELDLEDCVEGIEAQQISGYAIYMNGKSTRLSYPLGKFSSNVSGKSFHNGRFIQRMRNKASSLPKILPFISVKFEQGTVTSLVMTQGTVHGVHYRTKDGHANTAYAPLTIVCDGCFSKLRRDLCYSKIETPSSFHALILENTNLPYANHAHVILADPSIVLFYPISNTEIRCLVDVPREKIPSISNGKMATYLKTKVAPQIPCKLYDAFVAAVDKGNIKSMPNRSMPAEPKITPGVILIGDALDMRHPLTGGGMAVALSDIVLLRDLIRPLHDLKDACQHLKSFYTLRKPVSFTINTYANVSYKVFRSEIRGVCLDYLRLGPTFADGVMSIFAVLDPRPVVLFLHVAAMCVYGVIRLLAPFPSPIRLWLAAKLIVDAIQIMIPILEAEGVMQILGIQFDDLLPQCRQLNK